MKSNQSDNIILGGPESNVVSAHIDI